MGKDYVRHSNGCKHAQDATHHKCGCALWLLHKGERISAGGSVGTMRKKKLRQMELRDAGLLPDAAQSTISLTDAVEKYCTKRSGAATRRRLRTKTSTC